MADSKATQLSTANANDLPVSLSNLQDAGRTGIGETFQSLSPAASLGGRAASGWLEDVAVTTNVVILATAGLVVAVAGTTGNVTAACRIGIDAPATLECQVEYDATGIPTLTFFATDAVTVCAVQQIRAGVGVSAKLDEDA